MEIPLRPLTLDDVTSLAEADHERRFELSDGNLIVKAPETWRHQSLIGQLFAWLLAGGYHGRINHACGVRTATESLNGRVPDLVVTTGPVPDETVWLAPDVVALAVEIVSKGSERTDRWHKPMEYAAAGIRRFWRVEPDDTVVQFELADSTYAQVGETALDALLAGPVPDLS
jgi:Uma2 family endonuclease